MKISIIGQNQKDFEKYINIKGKFLFKQVYDFLLSIPGNTNATYYQVSSCIRYDKNLRDKLYIYLATFEEFLRAKIFDTALSNEMIKSPRTKYYSNQINNFISIYKICL